MEQPDHVVNRKAASGSAMWSNGATILIEGQVDAPCGRYMIDAHGPMSGRPDKDELTGGLT